MSSALVSPFIDRNLPKSVRVTKTGLPPDAVRKQLSHILQSDGFVHAGRMKRFLAFVVEETLAGRSGQLCEYSIAISVFDRSESFEPGLDPIVRNDARRLRQKLFEYYLRCGEQDPVIIEVPKGRYVPVFRCTSRQETANVRHQYRITVRLSRADGTELWIADEEFQLSKDSQELCFVLRLEARNQGPPVSMLPISQSSGRVQRCGKSRQPAAKAIYVGSARPPIRAYQTHGSNF